MKGKPIAYSYGDHKKTSPCMNCEERELGCHSHCERYSEFKQNDQIIKDKIHSNRGKESDCVSFIVRRKKGREY